MTYFMNGGNVEAPSNEYFSTIMQGYKDFGLPLNLLKKYKH